MLSFMMLMLYAGVFASVKICFSDYNDTGAIKDDGLTFFGERDAINKWLYRLVE